MNIDNTEELLIKGIKNDFLIKTGKHIKISLCNRWETLANFTYNITLDEVILMVTDKTGWDIKKLYNQSRITESLFRRGVIDYIAIHNGETLSSCGKKTQRDHSTVINSIKRFEERLETDSYVRQALSEIIGFCWENYYLYRGKTLSEQL